MLKKIIVLCIGVFINKCDSVKYYIELLNNHSAYENFRKAKQFILKTVKNLIHIS